MAVTYQALTAIAGSQAALTVNWPTHIAGDVAVLMVEVDNSIDPPFSSTAGFQQISGSPVKGDRTWLALYWCRATSNAMAAPVLADAGSHVVACMATFRGCVATGTPIESVSGQFNGFSNPSHYTAPGGTASTLGGMVVIVGANNTLSLFSGWACPGLTSITERADGSFAGSGTNGALAFATGAKALPGDYGPLAVDTAAPSGCNGSLMALSLISDTPPPGARMQAITPTTSSTGNLTKAWPTHVANDVALLLVQTDNQVISLSNAQGFVEIAGSPQAVGVGGVTAGDASRIGVYWCRASSSSMAAPTIAAVSGTVKAVMVTFRGLPQTGNPIDATSGSAVAIGTSVATYTVPGATSTTENGLIAILAGTNSPGIYTNWRNTDLSIATRLDDNGLGVATGMQAAPGAYGTTSVDTPFAGYRAGLMTVSLMGAPLSSNVAINADSSLTGVRASTAAFAGDSALNGKRIFIPPFIGNSSLNAISASVTKFNGQAIFGGPQASDAALPGEATVTGVAASVGTFPGSSTFAAASGGSLGLFTPNSLLLGKAASVGRFDGTSTLLGKRVAPAITFHGDSNLTGISASVGAIAADSTFTASSTIHRGVFLGNSTLDAHVASAARMDNGAVLVGVSASIGSMVGQSSLVAPQGPPPGQARITGDSSFRALRASVARMTGVASLTGREVPEVVEPEGPVSTALMQGEAFFGTRAISLGVIHGDSTFKALRASVGGTIFHGDSTFVANSISVGTILGDSSLSSLSIRNVGLFLGNSNLYGVSAIAPRFQGDSSLLALSASVAGARIIGEAMLQALRASVAVHLGDSVLLSTVWLEPVFDPLTGGVAWTMSTDAYNLSRYTHFPFNCVFEVDGYAVGLGDLGAYIIGGDNDAGVPIKASITTDLDNKVDGKDGGRAPFQNLRRPQSFYCERSGGELLLTLTSITTQGHMRRDEYPIAAGGPELANLRRNVARGLVYQYSSITVENLHGKPFELRNPSMLVDPLMRKI